MRGNRLEKSGDQSGQKGTSSEVPGSHSELRETSLSGGKFLAALSYLENQDWSDRSPFNMLQLWPGSKRKRQEKEKLCLSNSGLRHDASKGVKGRVEFWEGKKVQFPIKRKLFWQSC